MTIYKSTNVKYVYNFLKISNDVLHEKLLTWKNIDVFIEQFIFIN